MDVDVVFYMVIDIEFRKQWDAGISKLAQVESINSNEDVISFELNMPSPMSNRELVQYRSWVCNKTNPDLVTKYNLYQKENKYYVNVVKSVVRADVPEKKGVVRGETIISGVILEQDPTNPKNTLLKFISHTDPKGSIPEFMVKKAGPKGVNKFISGVTEAYPKLESAIRKKYGL